MMKDIPTQTLPSINFNPDNIKQFKDFIYLDSNFFPFEHLNEHNRLIPFADILQLIAKNEQDVLGIICHDLTYPSRLHYHDFLEITYIANGRLLYIADKEPYILPVGSICLAPPGLSHLIAPIEEGEIPLVVNFLIDSHLIAQLKDLLPRSLQLTSETNFCHFDSLPSFIIQTVQRLILDYIRSDFQTNYSILGHLLILFQQLDDLRINQVNIFDQLTLDCLEQIKKQPQTMSQARLAQEMNYSPGYLSRHIKKMTGQTVSQLIARKKLALAQQLLIDTDLTIRNIAEEAGYHSESHFHRLFKEKNMISPGQYRALMTK